MKADGTPLVSVLVLAYNHGPFLAAALDGILHQDFSNYEVLIGEDLSTDNTLEIALAYERRHPAVIKVISGPVNVGMTANHRRLVAAAVGQVIAYCEGDDYWHSPSKLSEQLRHLQANPDLVGVHTDFDHLVPSGNGWRRLPNFGLRHYGPLPDETSFADLLERNVVQTCTLVLRAQVAKAYLLSDLATGNFRVEDWPMCLFATSAGQRLGYLPQSTATYRRVSGSATNQGTDAELGRIAEQHQLIDSALRLRQDDGAARRGHERTDLALLAVAVHGANRAAAVEAGRALRTSPTLRTRLIGRAGIAIGNTPVILHLCRITLRALDAWRARRYR